MQLSEEIMYKNNKESSDSSSDGNVTKVVILGSGIAPANGGGTCILFYVYVGSNIRLELCRPYAERGE